ncbi:right-handed parallel beta-helix repeat-containing protein [Romboutsia timonensis]|uniref:right-handed parallel beta-helix repeat-containing protein n=1 Tax=Romboutsia timonensis TaxID=1776391 RepID=UPI0023F946B0|nr:right-handed parallel beta-helix repeat-containing protein [Romboutsia timonensis]
MNGTDDILALFFNNSNLPFDFKDINKKNLDDTIYLTENGFSEPVGIYDCQTRTAKLTKSIINKSLVIDIDNVTLNGNNYSIGNGSLDVAILISKESKNISIEYLKLNSYNIDVFIEPSCEDIKFNYCIFKGMNLGICAFLSKNLSIEYNKYLNSTGIMLYGCKDALIKSNHLSSNEKGIYLFEDNNNCNIIDNLFLDCIEGISIESKNSFNIISNNKFKNENNILQQYCISMLTCNHYNKITKNLIIFSYKSISYEVGSITSKFIGIYIEGDKNTFNTISKNKIVFKNNKYNFNNTFPNILITGISCYGNNSDLEISDNEIEITQNEFTMTKGSSQSVYLFNIYISNHSNCAIKNNICNINENSANLSLTDSLFELSNLVLDTNNKSIKIFCNEFEIYKNSYINNDSIFKAFNLILVDSNSDSDIKDNIFKIKSNNHGFIASINLWTENYGNKISYNKFIDIEGVSIILDSENIGNIIIYNTINCNDFAVVLNDGNNSNIIKANSLSTIASSNILLVLNNMNNLITENYIENEFLGIFLVINNNNFNSISFNEFCKTSQDISIPKNSYNYVFDNTKYFIEDNE